MIANEKIEPIICVFVPPVDRDNEYALTKTQQFESFIVDELMPHIDSTYRTMSNPQKRVQWVDFRMGIDNNSNLL